LAAGLISQIGDWILIVGVVYYTFALTGSALATGLTLASSYFPGLVLGSIAGVFVDRWPKRTTLIVVNMLLGIGLAPLVLATSAERVWIVYAVVLAESCLEQFFLPAQGAFLPLVVPRDSLPSANAAFGTARQVARLGGSAAGGLILFSLGIAGIALIDALSFFIAGGLMLLVPRDVVRAKAQATAKLVADAWSRFTKEWVDGLRTSWQSTSTRALLLFSLITGLGEGTVGALFAPFFSSVLGGNAAEFGFFIGVQGIGGIAGGAAAVGLAHRVPAALLVGAGAIVFGAIDLLLFTYPLVFSILWPAFLLIAAVGLPGAAVLAGFATLQQTLGDDRYRGRLIGALVATTSATSLIGSVAAGGLADRIGVVPVIAVQGLGYVVAGTVVLSMINRRTTRGGAIQASSNEAS